jgi:hypothetical protein
MDLTRKVLLIIEDVGLAAVARGAASKRRALGMTSLVGRTAAELRDTRFSWGVFSQKRPTLAMQLGKIPRDLGLGRVE